MIRTKLLVMDVDGTLTDGNIYIDNNGEAFKAFNIKDGYAIKHILPEYGITPVIITGRYSKIVENRCREIGIEHCYQNCEDKIEKLKELAGEFGLAMSADGKYYEIAYIGDDLNDLECMRVCGLTGCPADAVNEIKAASSFVSVKNGGDGAVRDIVDYMLGSTMLNEET